MSTTVAPTRPATMTAEDFYDWVHLPENRAGRYELLRGEVVEMSRVGERPGYVCLTIGRLLSNYTVEQRRDYVLRNDTGILPTRDPDALLTLVRRRDDDLYAEQSEEVPVLVVEVLSPNDRWPAVTRRVRQFLQRGVLAVWLVDPESRTVMIHRASQLPQVVEGDDELVCEDVLPGFRCRTADLFYLPGEAAGAGR